MKKQTIVIIDSDQDFIRDFSAQFELEGLCVEQALRVGDLLEKLINQQVVLIIANIELNTDCDVVGSVRKLDKDVPIITITANDSLEVQKKVRQEGIFFYFVKPFTIEDMSIVAHSAIDSRKQ